jgi:FAD/FMN-containing dehydrogenase
VQHGRVRRPCAGIRDQRGDKRVLLQPTFLAAALTPTLNGCCHALPFHLLRAFHQEGDAPLRELNDHVTSVPSFSLSDQPATYHLADPPTAIWSAKTAWAHASLAVPAGVVSRTGIAGLTLGGGVGWLVRRYGLTCDNVLSFEIVTADGKLMTASADENADLFWALRGGGGNFGVVTSFLFRAHPVTNVFGGMIVHARDHARDVIRHYRDFMTSAPEELTAYAALITTPDGHPAVAVIACYCGDPAQGKLVLRPLREFGSPLMDAVQPMPFPAIQKLLDGAFPDGTQNYWKSDFVREMSDEVIDLIVTHANRMKSPLSAVVIEYYGGAAGRIGISQTAFAQRQAEYDIRFMAQWTDLTEKEVHVAWARDMADALRPHASGGHLLNFLGEESPDMIQAAFGPNYARLAQVKKKYDPTNFFSINQNIKPAA